MYWIYLSIFILAVLVPDIIPENKKFLFFREEQIEELFIFLLGFIGFLIFRWQEKQSKKNLKERIKFQKESREISKNLNDTYSYIGETNRKLDIMKNISLNLSEAVNLDKQKQHKFLNTLSESVNILVKSKKFIVRFVDFKTKETLKEIKGSRGLVFKIENSDLIEKISKEKKNFFENNFYFFVSSEKKIDNTVAIIIISKNNRQQKLEDSDILKALASHSLFLFHYFSLRQNNR
jgi:predicted ribonuclease YlaK